MFGGSREPNGAAEDDDVVCDCAKLGEADARWICS